MEDHMLENNQEQPRTKKQQLILVISIIIAGLCSILYELLVSTCSSYFLGDSIKQFSITIGVYMASMGLGAFLSRRFTLHLVHSFIWTELLLSLIGGLSIPLLYFSFSLTSYYTPIMLLTISVIGVLTGLEVPFLTRILEHTKGLQKSISDVLSFDYLGALAATLAFPFFILPFLGVYNASIAVGMLNIGLAWINLYFFRTELTKKQQGRLLFFNSASTILLALALISSSELLKVWENELYEDRIVYTKQTPYQRIVLTREKDDLRLFLNGNLQFSSTDEYRYHETLVHFPIARMHTAPTSVLVLGGGDGLAIRELLKYNEIQQIDLVELDKEVIELCKKHASIKLLNNNSLADRRVSFIEHDAFTFIQSTNTQYDLIVIDLPDPNTIGLTRLYSKAFYHSLYSILSPEGVFITQATSPYFAKKVFWCINQTIQSSGFTTVPLHTFIPSFGDWGFIMGAKNRLKPTTSRQLVSTSFFKPDLIDKLIYFEKDIALPTDIEVNTLNNPVLQSYYSKAWKQW